MPWAGCYWSPGHQEPAGVKPEARTFNIIVFACNLCGQPLQAPEVYKKMCMRRIQPTDTIYTALISAYAKADRLEDALAAYKIMISEGHRRNAIRRFNGALQALRCRAMCAALLPPSPAARLPLRSGRSAEPHQVCGAVSRGS
ncbi:g6528 [Coccomyxa viridis]|uniref:G6528 protein n=1 Tax=Coccomyxa viridis TaxID=1274662 RepID=A0ABP1G0K6_9CHLO